MSITIEEIKKTAALAKLSIPENQIDSFLEKFNRVLELNKTLSAIPTKDIAPLSHPHEQTQSLREDAVTEANQRDVFLNLSPAKNHPATKEGLYVVPAVIESE